MNAPTALAPPTSSPVAPLLADDELDLAALLELFAVEEPEESEEPADPAAEAAPARRSLGAWTQGWLRRATEWGAGPGGAWRAW